MKKLAIFVEGQTEQLFISKLLIEIAGKKNIHIELYKSAERRNGIRSIRLIKAYSIKPNQKYYVLVRDCGNDDSVKSDIIEAYKGMVNQNYEKVLGLRDVYPHKKNLIRKLEKGLKSHLRQNPLPVDILLAVMEIEAWFLAETSHFQKIHPLLTINLIKNKLRWNPLAVNLETRTHPSEDLNQIYKLVGHSYDKRKITVERTINNLNYSIIYLTLGNKVKRLQAFIDQLNSFFS